MIDKKTILLRNPEILDSEIDGEKVMMSPETGDYFGLKDTANRIWELLEEPREVEQIVQKLTEEYEVEAEQCFRDILPFLEEMLEQHLLKVQPK